MTVIGPKGEWLKRKVSTEISLKVNKNKLWCSKSKVGIQNGPSSDPLGPGLRSYWLVTDIGQKSEHGPDQIIYQKVKSLGEKSANTLFLRFRHLLKKKYFQYSRY